jgi:ATP-binding cassette, subfamily B, bacterial
MAAANTFTFWGGWRERIRALRNVPALLRIVWESGSAVVSAGFVCRILGALVPLAMLWISKQILDGVQARFNGNPLPENFWVLVGAEAVLAAVGAILGRAAGFFDSLLADRFTRHVSVRVMDHASRLDLASYENPVFYDKLERARVQATDRIAMIQAIGTLAQQAVTAITLSVSIFWFSPWLLLP